jgi:hypothetical protein
MTGEKGERTMLMEDARERIVAYGKTDRHRRPCRGNER